MRANPKRFFMKRRHPLLGCVAIVSFFLGLSGMASAAPLQVAISAEFDHPSQLGTYRTLLSSVNSVDFTGDQNGGMTALFLMEPTDCFGIVSWVAADKQSKAVGPAVICLANSAVTELQFNSWLDRGKTPGVDPRLVISLGSPQPGEPIQPGQIQSQTRLNTSRVTAQIFLRGCDANGFHKYGYPVFEKGTLAFTFWTDDQGKSQVKMSAVSVSLEKLNIDTLNLIRDGCDAAGVLSLSPADGQGSFTGTSVWPPPDPSTLSGQFGRISDTIETLLFQGLLEDKEARKLRFLLDKSQSELRKIQVDQAIRELAKFDQAVGALVSRGQISEKDAVLLRSLSQTIAGSLAAQSLPAQPALEPELNSCSGAPGSCVPVTCDVVTRFLVGAKRPFHTILEALAEAERLHVCEAEVIVDAGIYLGDLNVTRHTRIFGPNTGRVGGAVFIAGSVVNTGPNFLSLENVTIAPSGDGMSSDHPCAQTEFLNVLVSGATGYGVRHRGGSLLAISLRVELTKSTPALLSHGTGIVLHCGARANFAHITLDRNESSALILVGSGTAANVFDLSVSRTGNHPSLAFFSLWGWGAVQIIDRATLRAEVFEIRNSRAAGVLAYMGGQGIFVEGTVADTGTSSCAPACTDRAYGSNMMSARSGRLEFRSFTSARAAQCGVHVAEDGGMDLFAGVVRENPIGACVQVPDYDLARLTNDVRYIDNAVTSEATDFAVPEPLMPVGL